MEELGELPQCAADESPETRNRRRIGEERPEIDNLSPENAVVVGDGRPGSYDLGIELGVGG